MAMLSPGNGVTFITLGRASHNRARTRRRSTRACAPHCLRIVRSGNVFRAYESLNGTDWKLLRRADHRHAPIRRSSAWRSRARPGHTHLHGEVQQRLAVRIPRPHRISHHQVSLTAPADGATYTTPATMNVSATASDTDGTSRRRRVLCGVHANWIGLRAVRYSVTWSNAPSGTHILTAVARDNSGATTTSGSRQVTIAASQPTLRPPSRCRARRTEPRSRRRQSVSMAATAADMNGTITKVEFYAGSTLVSTDTSSPYSATWNTSTAGTFTLTAKAFDNAGASTVSSGVNVTIAAQPVPRRQRCRRGGNRPTSEVPGQLAARACSRAPSPSLRQGRTSGTTAISSTTCIGRCRATAESPRVCSQWTSPTPGRRRA